MDSTLNFKEYIDAKLIRRLKILVLILVVMAGVVVYEIFISNINIFLATGGLFLGFVIGLIAGRMFSIEWHEESSKVVGRLDALGIAVLVLYILFSIARHWIFAHWLTGAVLSAFTFTFIEGAMLGRVMSLRFSIKKVLTEQGKIS